MILPATGRVVTVLGLVGTNRVDVTVLGLVGGAPGGETPRVADSSAAGAGASFITGDESAASVIDTRLLRRASFDTVWARLSHLWGWLLTLFFVFHLRLRCLQTRHGSPLAAAAYCSGAQQEVTKMSNLSATGALTAFGSGIMLGFGWALLNNDRFRDTKDVARTTIGGGFFVAGLYVWAPAGMRRMWLE